MVAVQKSDTHAILITSFLALAVGGWGGRLGVSFARRCVALHSLEKVMTITSARRSHTLCRTVSFEYVRCNVPRVFFGDTYTTASDGTTRISAFRNLSLTGNMKRSGSLFSFCALCRAK